MAKLRLLGYQYRGQKKRVDVWRHPKTLHYVSIPRRDWLDNDLVRSVLRQSALTIDEIEKFIAEAKA